MQHFYELTAIVDRSGEKCWEFQCRFCPWYDILNQIKQRGLLTLNSGRSFKRTVDGAFDTEPKLPKLQNLAGHVAECKGGKVDKEDEPTSQEQINLKQSVKMMEAYLKKGKLNPE
jgi:hypothetical protein